MRFDIECTDTQFYRHMFRSKAGLRAVQVGSNRLENKNPLVKFQRVIPTICGKRGAASVFNQFPHDRELGKQLHVVRRIFFFTRQIGSLLRSLEHVPDAVFGENIFGVSGVFFDFVAQVTDVHAQIFCLAAVLRSPDFAE